MKQVYVALTKEPLYNKDIKANLHARGIFKSTADVVTILQKEDKNITCIKNSRLPFTVSDKQSLNTAYIIECDVPDDFEKIYILQVTIANNYQNQKYIYCNSSEDELFAIMMEWLEEESIDVSDESITKLTEDLKQYGHHNFLGHEKECEFVMYYFDSETELHN